MGLSGLTASQLRREDRRMESLGKTFWVSSIAVALATSVALLALYEWQGSRVLIASETRDDVQTVRTMGNILWPNHGQFFENARELSSEELRAHPQQVAILRDIQQATRELPVLKVKVFSPNDGRTLFSTEAKQIGDMQEVSEGLKLAQRGQESSIISHREQFNAISGPVSDRDVVATYVPYYAQREAGAAVGAPTVIMELYSDVTERVAAHKQSRTKVVLGVLLTMFAVYLLVYLFTAVTTGALRKANKDKLRQEEKLRYRALHDNVTGLPNRTSFEMHVKAVLREKKEISLSVVLIEVARFKSITESMGLLAGDQVLKSIAQRLQASLGSSEKIFHYAGDLFLVLSTQKDGHQVANLAQSLVEQAQIPLLVDDAELRLSVDVGVARWPHDDTELPKVVRFAGLALQAAKEAGNNSVEIYRASMLSKHDETVRTSRGLEHALERKEFLLHYQPRHCAITRKVLSVEALLRWQHPDLGVLPPAKFIELLENSPLIVDVGYWILETACRQTRAWHQQGHEHLRVSVNVAPRQFRQRDFLQTVEKALDASGLPAKYLEIELTEGQLLHDLDNVAATLTRLRDLGVTVAIDDFGTGYSSLSYLHKLPIDCLKIDRSFVMSMSSDRRSGSIAQTIAMLGQNLGMSVVAEGVETPKQASALTKMGCKQLQGYLFSRPLDALQMSAKLKESAPVPEPSEESELS